MGKPSTAAAPKTDTAESPAPAPKPAAPAAAKAAPATEAPKPISALLASEFRPREAGIYFNTYEAVPPAGTPVENLLRPEFWSNVSQIMRPGSIVIAFPRDGKFYVELLVWDAGQNWAHVEFRGEPMYRPEFAALPGIASDFEIGRDPINGILVKRKSTGALVKGNFPNHQDALRWITDNQNALRR